MYYILKYTKNNVKTTHCEQYEEFLVVLPNTVVDPWTVVIHLAYAPLADGAVMRSVRLDATAFGALEDHLPFLETDELHHLLSGGAFRNRTLKTHGGKHFR